MDVWVVIGLLFLLIGIIEVRAYRIIHKEEQIQDYKEVKKENKIASKPRKSIDEIKEMVESDRVNHFFD